MTTETGDFLELRVLYGPQAGSRMSLAPGEYLLGCSDLCAVVLAGSRMQERHALLIVEPGSARLRPQEGTVSDGMGNDVPEEIVLTPGMPAELGGISITLDHPNAPWPDGRAAAMPVGHGAGGSASQAGPAASGAAAKAAAPAAPPAPGAPPVPASVPAATGGLRGGGVVLAVAGIVVAVVLGGVLAASFRGGQAQATESALSQHPPATPAEPPAALLQALRAWNPQHTLSVAAQPDNGWLVSGYVASETERDSLESSLMAISPVPVIKVFAEQTLVQAATDVLEVREDKADSVLRLESLGEGRLRLAGAARQSAQAQSARLALLAVPGVREVAMDVLLPEQLLATLKQRVASAGLEQKVSFVKEWPAVEIEGRFDAAETARWQDLLKAFGTAYGDMLPMSVTLAPPAAQAVAVQAPFNVRVIVGGAAPYIVTDQGVRMSRGSVMGGQRLIAVNEREVVFDGAQRWQVGR